MKMTKREVIVCACEVACCFIPSIVARVIMTLVKNYVRNSSDEMLDKTIKM